MSDLNRISGTIVDAACPIHSALGPGLRESVYDAIPARELEKRGLQVERQKPVPIVSTGSGSTRAFERISLLRTVSLWN
jgi:iron complex transport system substrate-binding protein